MIDNKIKETNLQVPCNNKNDYDSMELTRLKTKVDIKVKKNVPIIHINVATIGHIDEVLCNDNFDQAKILTKFEKLGEKEIKKIIVDGITEAQKLGADVYGFGDKFHTADPKEFKKYEKDWDVLFKKAIVKVDVQYEINNIGMRKKAYPY
jgi:spore germination protein KC